MSNWLDRTITNEKLYQHLKNKISKNCDRCFYNQDYSYCILFQKYVDENNSNSALNLCEEIFGKKVNRKGD